MSQSNATDKEFDEVSYLERYPDVAQAVARGSLESGKQHFEIHGKKEGRIGNRSVPVEDIASKWWIERPGDADRLGRRSLMMKFKSTSDLSALIVRNLPRISNYADLIVGIPRSGLLAANLIALYLNKPLLSLDDFLIGNIKSSSFTHRFMWRPESDVNRLRILIVDDSIGTGQTINMARELIEKKGLSIQYDISFLAIYASPENKNLVDHLEVLPHPRVFEWNYLHHDYTKSFCVDMDGILCEDPTVDENDDGAAYLKFLQNARPQILPRRGVGAIVTSRLEKYRFQTEEWLKLHGVTYERLIMLDLPSGSERRRLGAHAKLKANVYRRLGGWLFVESDPRQTEEIFALTKMPVYCPGANMFLS